MKKKEEKKTEMEGSDALLYRLPNWPVHNSKFWGGHGGPTNFFSSRVALKWLSSGSEWGEIIPPCLTAKISLEQRHHLQYNQYNSLEEEIFQRHRGRISRTIADVTLVKSAFNSWYHCHIIASFGLPVVVPR